MGKQVVRTGALAQEVESMLMVVVPLVLRVRKAAEVIIRYIERARRVRAGKN